MTIIAGTRGGASANKNCPQGRPFEQFLQVPGVCPGLPGGMLVARIDSHIIVEVVLIIVLVELVVVIVSSSSSSGIVIVLIITIIISIIIITLIIIIIIIIIIAALHTFKYRH